MYIRGELPIKNLRFQPPSGEEITISALPAFPHDKPFQLVDGKEHQQAYCSVLNET